MRVTNLGRLTRWRTRYSAYICKFARFGGADGRFWRRAHGQPLGPRTGHTDLCLHQPRQSLVTNPTDWPGRSRTLPLCRALSASPRGDRISSCFLDIVTILTRATSAMASPEPWKSPVIRSVPFALFACRGTGPPAARPGQEVGIGCCRGAGQFRARAIRPPAPTRGRVLSAGSPPTASTFEPAPRPVTQVVSRAFCKSPDVNNLILCRDTSCVTTLKFVPVLGELGVRIPAHRDA